MQCNTLHIFSSTSRGHLIPTSVVDLIAAHPNNPKKNAEQLVMFIRISLAYLYGGKRQDLYGAEDVPLFPVKSSPKEPER